MNNLELNHLFLTDRKCKSCGEIKKFSRWDFIGQERIEGRFRLHILISVKSVLLKGVKERKKDKCPKSRWEYPDW